MNLFEKIKNNRKIEQRQQNQLVFGASITDYNITKNFKYSEMIYSNTAVSHKISNVPNKDELLNIENLCKQILQPIRDKYGKPIKVNSCFRCPKVNQLVGGAKTSDHMVGAAADIKATDGNNKKLFDLILKMIKSGEIKCRQLIWEYGTKKSPQWIHISINNKQHQVKNNQILYLYSK